MTSEGDASGAQAGGGLAVEATRSSLWSLGGQVAQILIGLASFAILSTFLGPADYGLLGMAATVQGFLGVVGDSGMVAAVTRAPRLDGHVEATAFWVALAGAGVLAAVSVVTAPLLGWFFHEPSVTMLALALSGTFLIAAPARVSTAKLTRRLDFKRITLINSAANIGGLCGAWSVARVGGGAWALVVQTTLTFSIQTTLALLSAPTAASPGLISRAVAGELAGFSSQMSGFSISVVAARTGDSVLAGRFIGVDAVGVISMGVKLLLVPLQRVCAATSSVFLPTMLRLERERHAEAFHTALRLTSLVTIPLTLGVFAIAPEVVALLPSRWAVLTTPLRLFALGGLVEPLAWYALAAATARGRARGLLHAGLTLIPIGWLAATAGALSGKVEWMVVAWAVVNVIGAALILAVIWRDFGLDSRLWLSLARPHILGGVMVLAVRVALWGTRLAGHRLGAPVGILVGAGVYGALAFLFERNDTTRLVSLLGRASGAIRLRS